MKNLVFKILFFGVAGCLFCCSSVDSWEAKYQTENYYDYYRIGDNIFSKVKVFLYSFSNQQYNLLNEF